MGFKRGRNTANVKGHRWINYPNTATCKCTKCGIMRYVRTVKGVKMTTYEKNFIVTEECPDCV